VHGDVVSRQDKERIFATTVPLLDPYARQALGEINDDLLLGTGEILTTGMRSSDDGLDEIATAELHNLVFEANYRIIPAVTRGHAS